MALAGPDTPIDGNKVYEPDQPHSAAHPAQAIPGHSQLDASQPGHADYAYHGQNPYGDGFAPLLPGPTSSPAGLRQAEESPATPQTAAAGQAESQALANPHEKQSSATSSWEAGEPFPRKEGESNGQRVRRFAKEHKKSLSIGSILGGGGITAIIFGFVALTPLKLEHIIQNLESKFGASATSALNQAVDNAINGYVTKYVLPGLDTGRCTTTVAFNCVGEIKGHNPVSRLYQAWKNAHLESTLANKYHISFVKQDGKLYMFSEGQQVLGDTELRRAMINDNITLADLGEADNPEAWSRALQALREVTNDELLVPRIYHRHIFGVFLKLKYGVRRCLVICQVGQKIKATVAEQKLLGKSFFYDIALRPFIDNAGEAILCAANTSALQTCNDVLQDKLNSNPDEVQAGDIAARAERLTGFQADLVEKLGQLSAEDLADVIARAAAIKEAGGIEKYIIQQITTKLFGETAGRFALDAIPYIGWVLIWAQVTDTLASAEENLGPLLRHISFAIAAASAVRLYMMFRTAMSEAKTGNSTLTALSSFTQLTTANMSGSSTDISDATDAPLYQKLFGGGGNASKYLCNDGKPIPSGQIVCPEEKLDQGNYFANTLHDTLDFVKQLDPDFATILQIAHFINNNPLNWLLGEGLGKLMEAQCAIQDAIPPQGGCTKAKEEAGQAVSNFTEWLVQQLVPSPFNDHMSGGRVFDMMAAGADASENESCHTQLGCAKLTNQQVAEFRNEQDAADKAAFSRLSVFARIFSTGTPYSLVSRAAMAIPSSPVLAIQQGFASVLSNPFGPLSNLFSSLFAHNLAFAASVPFDDPFGVIQYGYPKDAVPKDPETFWNQHCTGDFSAAWENAQQQDPNTGEAVALTTQPCLLIQSMVQSAGGISDPSLLPPDSLNPDSGAASASGSCGGNGAYSALVGTGATVGNPVRIDQGIDFVPVNTDSSHPKGSPYDICAPASGTILIADPNHATYQGTPGRTLILEKLNQAPTVPNSSQYIYFDEIITIGANIKAGAQVNAGDVLGTNDTYPGIEVGWGSQNGAPLCGLGIPTPCGQSFNDWALALSGGTTQ